MNYEKTVYKAIDIYKENWVTLSVSTLVVFALGMITFGLLFGPLIAGLASMFNKAKSGNKPTFDDLFKYNGKFIIIVLMGILTGILVFIGFIFLVLPGILLATLWMYSLFAIAFDNKGIIDAMKTSWAFVMKNGLWQNVVILLAIGILNCIGGAVVVGPLITIPLSMGFLAMLYDENK